ncbi:MAG TPA: Rieske (2Fe-2S) protein [Spongiibacteraceae bacterium]|jgi:nitrite reductase/ring-hydroxylating ferredoxin subunit|nr:Rieske (2Fe-2S) protein [Spongiibacteraceae bacterium]HUH39150.1 Rieske (2Fe-2S) protein [Spongiibacteraceae bacterium]
MRYYALDKLINLGEGYRKAFRIDQHQLLLVELDGERHLIEGRCPHRGHPLTAAAFDAGQLRCPLHGYRFALDSGALLEATEQPCRGLRVYELVYRDRDVGVMLP